MGRRDTLTLAAGRVLLKRVSDRGAFFCKAASSFSRPCQESLMSLGVVLATCIGAVAFQPVVPGVLQDMGQPGKFPRAMLAAVVTCGCLYLAVMLCGYHGYGAFILQDIVQSMTHSPKDVQEAFDDEAEAWNWTGAKSLWVPALVSSLVLVNIVLSHLVAPGRLIPNP